MYIRAASDRTFSNQLISLKTLLILSHKLFTIKAAHCLQSAELITHFLQLQLQIKSICLVKYKLTFILEVG